MENNILRINYGKGNFNVDLDRLMPCTQKEFKMILDMVDKAENIDELTSRILNYIDGQIEESTMKAFCYANRIKEDSYKKKMLALKDILVNRYGIKTEEPEEIKEERPRLKSTIVYVFKNEGQIVNEIGWTFEKGGYTFSIYKTEYGRYVITLYGLRIGMSYKNKPAAIDSINNEIFIALEKNAARIAECKKSYESAMVEAGYMDKVEEPEIAVEVAQASDEKATANRTNIRKIADNVAVVILNVQYRQTAHYAQYAKKHYHRHSKSTRTRTVSKCAIAVSRKSPMPLMTPCDSSGHTIRVLPESAGNVYSKIGIGSKCAILIKTGYIIKGRLPVAKAVHDTS